MQSLVCRESHCPAFPVESGEARAWMFGDVGLRPLHLPSPEYSPPGWERQGGPLLRYNHLLYTNAYKTLLSPFTEKHLCCLQKVSYSVACISGGKILESKALEIQITGFQPMVQETLGSALRGLQPLPVVGAHPHRP